MNTSKKNLINHPLSLELIEELHQEYIAMGKDKEQDEIMKDWDVTIDDGISEQTGF